MIHDQQYNYDNRFIISTKYLLANGYYGYRGTLSEDTAEDMVAWNLNGIYDQVDDLWRESINAFNPLYTYIKYNHQTLHPKHTPIKYHSLSLETKTGLLNRQTIFQVKDTNITINSQRFANQISKHFIHEKYTISADKDITIDLFQGIDTKIYNLSGNHIKEVNYRVANDLFIVDGYTTENNLPIEVFSRIKTSFNTTPKTVNINNKILHHYQIKLQANKRYTCFIHAGVIHTDLKSSHTLLEAVQNMEYDTEQQKNLDFWKNQWNQSKIKIIDNQPANEAINYDIFQLISHRPYNHTVSIPARGLSGQVYKGAVFWDTEIYMFLFYLLTDIESAKNIINYRINGLNEAKHKANQYGFDGAFYAWESQENGFDACSDYNLTDSITKEPIRTYFKELQIHINGAIVYALNQYYQYTNDFSLIEDGGFKMLVEINRFYADYLSINKNGQYECLNVIGPDEYHEHVNNNAYTNYLIHFCMDTMLSYYDVLLKKDSTSIASIKRLDNFLVKAKDIRDNIILPKANCEGIIPQFDGYLDLNDVDVHTLLSKKHSENEYLGGKDGLATKTQIIKQADVILLLVMFPNLFEKDIYEKNYLYYKKRTEHGSSLSKAIYSILASRLGYEDDAYQYFINGASIDLTGHSKQYAGGIYIGGNHLAAYGGAYMATVLGFLGYDYKNNKINPKFSRHIKDIKINIERGKIND